jgi:hypothetical protein
MHCTILFVGGLRGVLVLAMLYYLHGTVSRIKEYEQEELI